MKVTDPSQLFGDVLKCESPAHK